MQHKKIINDPNKGQNQDYQCLFGWQKILK